MPLPYLEGGFGQAAFGQHECGAGQSVIEPRFMVSEPLDGKHNVPRDQWVEYEVYYYSSFPTNTQTSPLVFELSEDGGQTFADATQAPYDLTYRFLAGHRLWIKILKTGLWAPRAEVILRTTGEDEHGQEITKDLPVRWE